VSDDEIRVGLSASVSGKFQLQGQQALNGVLLGQSYANDQGGISINGEIPRAVRLIWYDDASRVSRTRKNVLRLIRDDNVDILLGPYSSILTTAAGEIAEEFKKILWNYGGTSDEIFNRGWRHMIGIASPASDYFRALPLWLAKQFADLRRICILHSSKGSFGRQVVRGVLESSQEASQSLELVRFEAPVKNNDPALLTLLDLSPEAVVLAGSFQDELALMRTRPRWPTSVQVVAAVAAGIAAFSSQLGQMADGVIGPSQWEPEVNFPRIIGPTSDCFANSFQKQFASKPDYIAAGSFATALIVTECIRRTHSLDTDKLRGAASELDCHTFYGHFRIAAQSGKQLGHQMLLIRWHSGGRIVLPSSKSN